MAIHQSVATGPFPGEASPRRARVRKIAWILAGFGLFLTGQDALRAEPIEVELAVETADWPQFRGPTGQGQTADSDLPARWSESENIVWKSPVIGKGWSSPVISGNDLWLTTATQSGRSLHAVCYDIRTGKVRLMTPALFEVDPRVKGLQKAGHAAPTPLLDGDRVFVHFGTHGTACLNRQGDVLWKRVIPYYHHHGPGSSPVLAGDTLVIACDGFVGPFFDKVERDGVDAPQFVIGLDAATGEIRWKSPRDGKHSYATPLVIEVEGRLQVVSPGGDGVWSYDPETGREIWSHRFVGHSLVPRPVHALGHLFICTGYHEASLLAIRDDSEGVVEGAQLTWKLSRGVPFVPSPVVVDETLYMVSDDGILSAVQLATGKVSWKHRLGGQFSASPLAAGKRLYLCSEEGLTHVVQAGPHFRQLNQNQLPGKILASPAAVGNRIYLRTEGHLYCLGESGEPDEDETDPPVRLTGGEGESESGSGNRR